MHKISSLFTRYFYHSHDVDVIKICSLIKQKFSSSNENSSSIEGSLMIWYMSMRPWLSPIYLTPNYSVYVPIYNIMHPHTHSDKTISDALPCSRHIEVLEISILSKQGVILIRH